MNLLYEMFCISVTGSIVFLLFIGVEKITKYNFSAAWHYGLLKCILLFFCLPIGHISNDLVGNMLAGINVWQGTNSIKQSQGIFSNYIQQVSYGAISKDNLLHGLALIWLIGVVIILLSHIAFFLRFRGIVAYNNRLASNQLQEVAEQCRGQKGIRKPIKLYVNEYISTPMLIGFISPIIILPSHNLDGKNAEYVLSHELTHYKQKDLFIKVGSLLIRSIHWFNPLVYILCNKIDKWCEYTCDEKNAISLTLDMKKKYGLAILDAAERPVYGSAFGTPFLLPNQNLKERLLFMLNVKKMAKGTKIFSFTIAAVIMTFGFATALAAEMNNESVGYNAKIVDVSQDGKEITYEVLISEGLATKNPSREEKRDAYYNEVDQ